MKITVDRFEGEFAVCEIQKGVFVNLPRQVLQGAEEGDIVSIEVLKSESNERREKLQSRLNGLFNKNK